MSVSQTNDEKPLDPAAARVVARMRWLMLISGVTTMVAIAAVLGVTQGTVKSSLFRARRTLAQTLRTKTEGDE